MCAKSPTIITTTVVIKVHVKCYSLSGELRHLQFALGQHWKIKMVLAYF